MASISGRLQRPSPLTATHLTAPPLPPTAAVLAAAVVRREKHVAGRRLLGRASSAARRVQVAGQQDFRPPVIDRQYELWHYRNRAMPYGGGMEHFRGAAVRRRKGDGQPKLRDGHSVFLDGGAQGGAIASKFLSNMTGETQTAPAENFSRQTGQGIVVVHVGM